MWPALAVLSVATIVACGQGSMAAAQPPHVSPGVRTEAEPWLERLQWWTSAITRHQIGTRDDTVDEVAAWSIADVQNLAVDVKLLVSMMRNESLDPNEFRLPQRDARGRVTLVRWRFVSREQADVLRALAHAEARRGDSNRLLKRGAMLHTDVGMHASPPEQPAVLSADARPRRVEMYFADGQRLNLVDTAPHWNIARALLDDVLPSPGRDPLVRLWYQATSAYQQREEQLDPGHLTRAMTLFARDPDLLFFNACLHETYAAPAAHRAIVGVSLPAGLRLDVESVGGELRQAERLFRQALDLQPAFAEARLRLGRVLSLLGHHQDAAVELRRMVSESDDPLLLYYGHLFLGGEEAALGRLDAAHAAYERAAALYPQAQSPHLGLSQLADRSNDREAAQRSIARVLMLPSAADERIDPWWTYHVAQGRTADERLEALRRLFTTDELK